MCSYVQLLDQGLTPVLLAKPRRPRARQPRHEPVQVGVVGSCRNFWTRGHEIVVEYDRLYEIPNEGFHVARRRCEREEMEEAGVGRKRHGLRQKLMLGLGIGDASARAVNISL